MKNPGRVFFVILFVVGALGMAATGLTVYIRLAYLSALLLFVSFLWTYISLAGIQFQRRARSLRASVGDIFEETFEVRNIGRLPRLYVEVLNESALPQAAGSRILAWVRPGQVRSYFARTWLTQRGAFSLGPTTIASGDPFGLFPVKQIVPGRDKLVVLPLIIPIHDFFSPLGFLPGGKAIRRKSFEVTPHASGVREYVTGDPLKRIHWASSARRDKLMVKEFEQDPQAEVWIFLDAQREVQAELANQAAPTWQQWIFDRRPEMTLPASTLEYGVSIAASLAHYFISGRRAVGLVAGGPVYTVIPAERSERQESKVLETLAFVTGEGKLSLASLVDLQAPQMPLGSSALLVTPSVDDNVLLAVELLQRRNLRPVVVLLIAETFGGNSGSEELAARLAQRAIPVCRVDNGANLREVLSNFAVQSNPQESHRWREQLSTPSI
jgi:uncharacterized protein (DUF58 family)